MDILQQALDTAFSQFKPDILFFNAGTDCLEGDPLNGGVSLSPDGIVARDAMVFREARSRGVPVVMVLSGGYARHSAATITQSILNLARQEHIFDSL